MKDCAKSLVFPSKANPNQPVPFLEIDRWRWISGLYADHTAVHLGWRPEIVLSHLHDQARRSSAQGQEAKACSNLTAYGQRVALTIEEDKLCYGTLSRWDTRARSWVLTASLQ